MITDQTVKTITDFVKQELNKKSQEVLNINLVNSVRYFDDPNVPLTDYPMLKVFRTTDLFFPQSTKQTSQLTLRYCLSYEQMDQIAPLTAIISKLLNSILNDSFSKIQIEILSKPQRAEYRTLYSENLSAVYAFLNYYFEINESSLNYENWLT